MRHGHVDNGTRPSLRHNCDAMDVAVRYHMNLSFQVSKDGRTQRHPLDNTGHVSNLDPVADTVLIFKEDEETGNDVLHKTLRAESNGESGDARACENGSDVEAKLRADGQHDDDNENAPAHAPDNMSQCFRPLLHAGDAQDIAWRNNQAEPRQRRLDHLKNEISDDDDPGDSEQWNDERSFDQTVGFA